MKYTKFFKISILIFSLLALKAETYFKNDIKFDLSYGVQDKQILSKVSNNFFPDFYIKEQLPQDKELLKKVRKLFYERSNKSDKEKRKKVFDKCVEEYGAKEVYLKTDDGFNISSLYFKRENSPINIIYVTGYFHDQTPLKEWCAPFAEIFPEYNILSFDWRGFGSSDGKDGKWTKNDFGSNAYPDILAAIDFIRKENDKPVVLVGFCFGAAIALKATLVAQKEKRNTPDLLVLNSIFKSFENQYNRAILAEKRWYRRLIMNFLNKLGFNKYVLDHILTGSLFELKPIEVINELKIPCYFEHFVGDPFAIIEEGIEVFNKVDTQKKYLFSDIGSHVRIHSIAPWQYKEHLNSFLKELGFI
ncbi:alpha/beta fold hydrolase [Candidatus Dependentiae bacterium]|nr:alpha/beta fold hydrolase [Candidatus Dependentiae bacterium]